VKNPDATSMLRGGMRFTVYNPVEPNAFEEDIPERKEDARRRAELKLKETRREIERLRVWEQEEAKRLEALGGKGADLPVLKKKRVIDLD
jgi:hypothetical protein